MDILVLNTAVVDFRRKDFDFTDNLAGEGGLARCETEDMPGYSQEQLAEWIRDGYATPGGIGNSAPLSKHSTRTKSRNSTSASSNSSPTTTARLSRRSEVSIPP